LFRLKRQAGCLSSFGNKPHELHGLSFDGTLSHLKRLLQTVELFPVKTMQVVEDEECESVPELCDDIIRTSRIVDSAGNEVPHGGKTLGENCWCAATPS
jgi:hypothetical protein